MGTAELPWVPCSPPSPWEGAELSGKAGGTLPSTQGWGLGGGLLENRIAQPGVTATVGHPSQMHPLCTVPASSPGNGQGRQGLTRQLPALPAPHPPIPFPLNLSPHPLVSASSQGCTSVPGTAGWRWDGRAGLGWAEGLRGILQPPSQTQGGWGRERLGSHCPPRMMNELTIGY